MPKVVFESHLGNELAANLELPDGTPRAYAIFAHCFTCSKDHFAPRRISRALAAAGIAVLRFDFTGLGSSEGDFANSNFSSNVGDLVAAADFLAQHHRGPSLLIGHSLGGAAVLRAAHEIESVRALVTIGAPGKVDHVTHLFGEAVIEIEERGVAEVSIGGRPFEIQRQFLDDIRSQELSSFVGTLKRPLLILHSPRDQTVGIENASQIFVAAKHPKSFISLDEADHLLSDREDAEFVASVIAGWANRYIGKPTAEASKPTDDHDLVVVEETGNGKFQHQVTAGGHQWLADEPTSFGGDDTGPSPYQMLLASLGACTSMTLRMYADRKGWSIQKISVDLTHDKIHAKDCEECEQTTGKIDLIRRVLHVDGDLDDEQRSRLHEIADKCPVHRTLEGQPLIKTIPAEEEIVD